MFGGTGGISRDIIGKEIYINMEMVLFLWRKTAYPTGGERRRGGFT